MNFNDFIEYYLRVSIDRIKTGQPLCCAVYIFLERNKKIIKLKSTDGSFDEQELKRYQDKGVKYVFIANPLMVEGSYNFPDTFEKLNPSLAIVEIPENVRPRYEDAIDKLPVPDPQLPKVKRSDPIVAPNLEYLPPKSEAVPEPETAPIVVKAFAQQEEEEIARFDSAPIEESITKIESVIEKEDNEEVVIKAAEQVQEEVQRFAVQNVIEEEIVTVKGHIEEAKEEIIRLAASAQESDDPTVISGINAKIEEEKIKISGYEKQVEDNTELRFAMDKGEPVEETRIKAFQEKVDDSAFKISADKPVKEELIRIKNNLNKLQDDKQEMRVKSLAHLKKAQENDASVSEAIVGSNKEAQVCAFVLSFAYALGYRDYRVLENIARAKYLRTNDKVKDDSMITEYARAISSFDGKAPARDVSVREASQCIQLGEMYVDAPGMVSGKLKFSKDISEKFFAEMNDDQKKNFDAELLFLAKDTSVRGIREIHHARLVEIASSTYDEMYVKRGMGA